MSNEIKKYMKIDVCKLKVSQKWSYSFLVTFPVSYEYNGGFVDENTGKFYSGYAVVNPKIPEGFKLTSIGCGLQLNVYPPYATYYLEPMTPEAKKISKKRSTLKTYLAEQGC
jgi:hypothetical protein